MKVPMKTNLGNQNGQTLVEYALILLLIALVVAGSIPGVATALAGQFTVMASVFP